MRGRLQGDTLADVRARLVVVALVVGVLAAVGAGPAAGPAASDASTPEFADWTAVSWNVASGMLLGQSLTLSGTHVWPTPTSVLDGSWAFFDGPDFTPPLPHTDMIQISGDAPAYSYTLQFGTPVANPVLDLGSLGSRLDFPASIPIVRISGDSGFSVQGSSVIGTPNPVIGPDGTNDSNGTVQLEGTFQTITFTATYPTPGVEDGILVQVGAPPPPTTTTTTTTTTTPPVQKPSVSTGAPSVTGSTAVAFSGVGSSERATDDCAVPVWARSAVLVRRGPGRLHRFDGPAADRL